ncbi:MAG: PASTA domain-containing protein [Clostridiales bacterium]|nr:PASTA domain-containing protein [Clostridiales bacterium]
MILYTDTDEPESTVSVPDVSGKLSAAVKRLILGAGLNIKMEGAVSADSQNSAVAVSQSPSPGEIVPPGTVVTVEFRHLDGTD